MDKVKPDILRQAHDLYKEFGNWNAASRASGIPPSTLRNRYLRFQTSKNSTPRDLDIENICIESYINHKSPPTYSFLSSKGISRNRVKSAYGNITNLINTVEKKYYDSLKKHVLTKSEILNLPNFDSIHHYFPEKKRFIVTTAIAGCAVHEGFLNSLRSYCNIRDANMLIMVTATNGNSAFVSDNSSFDPALRGMTLIFNEVKLNDSIILSDIRIGSKMIDPTTGITRLALDNSIIVGSPKQHLSYTPTDNDHKVPHAVMMTGAITIGSYQSDSIHGMRTDKLARTDHIVGGIVIEIIDDKFFHFRQIQSDENGSFIDLCKKYNPDGSVNDAPAILIPGDWHAGATDLNVRRSIGEILREFPITEVVLHDFFDGYSINHHDRNNIVKSALKRKRNLISLKDEIKIGSDDLKWFFRVFDGQITVVKSNHDEFLERFISTKDFTSMNDENTIFAAKLLGNMFDDNGEQRDILRYAYEDIFGVKSDRIRWLTRNDTHKTPTKIVLGAHGDKGINGARGTMRSIESAYKKAVVGHNHSAAILRGVYRVGTSSRLKLDYNDGPSNWTQTSCLLYENGSRQLINFLSGRQDILGSWRLQ